MSRIKITADSTCDLSKEIIEKLDICITPLYVNTFDSFRDGVDITPDDIYSYVQKEGKLPKTSAVAILDYDEVFQKYSKEYTAVVHINIGAEFSSCFANAQKSAEKFENVFVVDSKNLSAGSGHIVMLACEFAKTGMEAHDIVKKLEEIIPKVEASFVVDTLEYLHMGGRCSSVAKVSANILKIKPCISVVSGKMSVTEKYRGNIGRAIEKYVAERLKNRKDIDLKRIFITHTKCDSEIIDKVYSLVNKYQNFEEIIITDAGCTITTHCGPSTLGILFLRKD